MDPDHASDLDTQSARLGSSAPSCHHFSQEQSSLLVAGKLRHSPVLCWGLTPSLDSGAVWSLPVPERVTSKHCSSSSPSLSGEMQLSLPRRGMGCPKVAQTHPLQSSPWPCCPLLLSALVPRG